MGAGGALDRRSKGESGAFFGEEVPKASQHLRKVGGHEDGIFSQIVQPRMAVMVGVRDQRQELGESKSDGRLGGRLGCGRACANHLKLRFLHGSAAFFTVFSRIETTRIVIGLSSGDLERKTA